MDIGTAFMLFIGMLVLFLAIGSLIAVTAVKRRKAKEAGSRHSTAV
jgi:hypothetical protein